METVTVMLAMDRMSATELVCNSVQSDASVTRTTTFTIRLWLRLVHCRVNVTTINCLKSIIILFCAKQPVTIRECQEQRCERERTK